jgi:ankyrin repeat protein
MAPSSEPPQSTLLGSTTHDDRIEVFLRMASLSPPEQIPSLATLPVFDSPPYLQSSSDAARSLLVETRINTPGYRQPEKQLRHHFRLPSQRKAKCNEENWVFTKHEVAKAFDSLLSSVPLPMPGIAKVLLSHASITSLDELWLHLHDAELDKRTKSRLRRSTSSVVPKNTWLNKVTFGENLEYIVLMCQIGVGQEVLDQAFSIALSKHSMYAMEALLRFGAVASNCKDAIREYVRGNDLALAKLLLAAPKAMSVEAWRHCIEPEIESFQASGTKSPTILLMCLAHRPDVICGLLLLKALESANFQATAIILAYAGSHEDFHAVRPLICKLACRIENDELRHELFKMLAGSGFVADGPVLREELMKDVKTRQIPLIKLLADVGVSLDIEPDAPLYWAVSQLDLEILELLKSGKFSSPASLALKFVPDAISEPDMLRLMEILAPRGLAGEPLDLHLVRAVRKEQVQVVDMLLRYGASVEYEQASAIRTALEKVDINIFSTMLQKSCSPEILSAAIPVAMDLQSRPSRLQAVKALVEKGVLAQELGLALQSLVSEEGVVDSDLVQLLLQHKAPVDGVGNDANNALLVAVRRGILSSVRMMCDSGLQNDTLSKAVPIAFGVVKTSGYDVALEIINLLLQKGATGLPVHQTLLTAVREDHQLDIVSVLLAHGAEANFATGASFVVALETSNLSLLALLCARCPPSRSSIESVLLTAIKPQHYNLQALQLILGSIPSAIAVTAVNALWTSENAAWNALWTSEKFKGNNNMTSMVSCLLRYGLDIDLGNGLLLCFAIQERNFELLSIMLSANPKISSLITGFKATTTIQHTNIGLGAMRLLLEKAGSAEIGQSEALYIQTCAALNGNLAGLRLLLRHKAIVDFDDGRALQAAARAGSIEVLDLLLLSRPASFTISRACLAAALSEIDPNEKQSVFECLLASNNGLSTEDMSQLLADSVKRFPECTELPLLLLSRQAEVKYETLETALETSCKSLFVALVGKIENANIVVSLFRRAHKMTIVPIRRYWIYHCLLSRGIPSDDVSEALLSCLTGDEFDTLSCAKLLLEHGAAVGYKNAAAFTLALRANSLVAVKLMSQYLVDSNTACVAFDCARKTAGLSPNALAEVYRCLLQWNISESSVYHALVDNLNGGHSDIGIVQLLLDHGADPNQDKAYCFVAASKAGAVPEFRAISKHARLSVVSNALLNHFQEERDVLAWFNICCEEQPHTATIDDDELLFKCMRKFPQETALLSILLDKGVSATATTTHRLCPGWQLEPCTALIWALFSKPRVENNVILQLILAGGRDLGLSHIHHISCKLSQS